MPSTPSLKVNSFLLMLLATTPALAQNIALQTAPPVSSPFSSPVGNIRNKISAGDLLSAESILEVHRLQNGEDGPWLVGLSWLARGALLVGDTGKATRYAALVRAVCAERFARGSDLEKDHELEISYGAVIEVEAQRIERTKGGAHAAAYLLAELAKLNGPVTLIARLHKRLNMITLEGARAPELEFEEYLGSPPPTLSSLRGKPVAIFIWAYGCGDCRAQAPAFAQAKARFADKGLHVVTLTRYDEHESLRARERCQIDSVWRAFYSDVGDVPMVISTASVQRYGGSSTPTFVFLDRAGIVRKYTPTRLTESELDSILEELTR